MFRKSRSRDIRLRPGERVHVGHFDTPLIFTSKLSDQSDGSHLHEQIRFPQIRQMSADGRQGRFHEFARIRRPA